MHGHVVALGFGEVKDADKLVLAPTPAVGRTGAHIDREALTARSKARLRQTDVLQRQTDTQRPLIDIIEVDAAADIEGETSAKARERLERLDYRKTLKDYKEAEKKRKAAAKARLKALKKAQARETAARGWRE